VEDLEVLRNAFELPGGEILKRERERLVEGKQREREVSSV
jgi:hypothetical protein